MNEIWVSKLQVTHAKSLKYKAFPMSGIALETIKPRSSPQPLPHTLIAGVPPC